MRNVRDEAFKVLYHTVIHFHNLPLLPTLTSSLCNPLFLNRNLSTKTPPTPRSSQQIKTDYTAGFKALYDKATPFFSDWQRQTSTPFPPPSYPKSTSKLLSSSMTNFSSNPSSSRFSSSSQTHCSRMSQSYWNIQKQNLPVTFHF